MRPYSEVLRYGIFTIGKKQGLHMNQVVHQARAYPGFCNMKPLGVSLLPLDGMIVHHRFTPSIKFTGTDLYTWVETQ